MNFDLNNKYNELVSLMGHIVFLYKSLIIVILCKNCTYLVCNKNFIKKKIIILGKIYV